MRKSTKLSDALHIILHMAQASEPLTSEKLAKPMQTNPVVVRRLMSGLKNGGLVISEKGHNGGWQLSCDLRSITLHDFYKAIGSPPIIAIGNRNDSSTCRVESAVNEATNNVFHDAEAALIKSLQNTTLADLAKIITKPTS